MSFAGQELAGSGVLPGIDGNALGEVSIVIELLIPFHIVNTDRGAHELLLSRLSQAGDWLPAPPGHSETVDQNSPPASCPS